MIAFIKKWKKFYIVNLAVAIFTYFMIISQGQLNYLDGIWHSGFAIAGNWERSGGRWVWPFFDKFRFGLQTEPMCSVTALAIFVLGNVLVLELFEISPASVKAYIISFLFLVNTSIGIWLTFRYTSITFATPYMTSVLAVLIAKQRVRITIASKLSKGELLCDVITVLAGGISLMVSLGTYQAFFDCTCLVALAVFMVMLVRGVDSSELLGFFIRTIAVIASGTLMYFVGLKISLAIHNMELGTYNAASSLSVTGIIANMPDTIEKTLSYFRRYFFEVLFRWNRLQEQKAFLILISAVAIGTLILGTILTFKKNKINGILFLICGLLMPVATNVVLFMATESYVSIQMTAGLSFFLPMCMAIAYEVIENWRFLKEKSGRCMTTILTVVCVITIYGNYISTQIDQQANYEGKAGTVTIAREIMETLFDTGFADRGGSVCFVGAPCGNERFMYSELYPMANDLMQFGNWKEATSSTHTQTWVGVYREYLGYYIQPCQPEEYDTITARDDVAAMPMFPRAGSIREIDGVTVIKISNNY